MFCPNMEPPAPQHGPRSQPVAMNFEPREFWKRPREKKGLARRESILVECAHMMFSEFVSENSALQSWPISPEANNQSFDSYSAEMASANRSVVVCSLINMIDVLYMN